MKHFLVRSSVFLLTFLSLQVVALTLENKDCVQGLKPQFESIKYRATIDVVNKHLSGILFFKTQEDSIVRAVFMNEMGATFFDIEFKEASYRYISIMENLDKKAVKKTLAKDIGMILCRGIYKDAEPKSTILGDQQVITCKLKCKGHVKYTTTMHCDPPSLIENYGKRKAVISIYQFYKGETQVPDSIFVQHHKVNFTIRLKQLDATE